MTEDSARAGFWRRFWSALIDFVIVLTPFQLLAIWLFIGTAGHVQMAGGAIKFMRCNSAQTIPEGLAPPPPEGWNVANDCWTSFFGATTAHTLTVARALKSGATGVSFSRSYALDGQGAPVEAFDLDNVALPLLLVYLIAMKSVIGQSIGDRAVRVKLVEINNLPRRGPHVWRMVARYLAMTLGFLPAIAYLGFIFLEYGAAGSEHMSATLLIFLVGVAVVWGVNNIVQVARKRDPVYDRICGVSVLRI